MHNLNVLNFTSLSKHFIKSDSMFILYIDVKFVVSLKRGMYIV